MFLTKFNIKKTTALCLFITGIDCSPYLLQLDEKKIEKIEILSETIF
jgi:hypothetical protein